ncbi:ABC transporter permease, partial [Bacillus sp. S1-R1J2-FB]|uniref:ABC transporter permease subunit n=1 Tax=Bacillus sp. S1-R1J2-FB TaxID=1973494 RepID=UPI001122D22F
LYRFGCKCEIFPNGGRVDPTVEKGKFDDYLSKLKHMILPALPGALIATVGTVHYLRSEITDTKHNDFVRTVRAKGVPESQIYSRHILRNSFLPIAAFLVYEIQGLVGCAIFLESIFSYPGIGQLFIHDFSNRAFRLLSAIVMVSGLQTL